ncbi:hypothetical protein [Paenibacillus macerans]|uniref:hypothetical protein n=1 Tax=Paenibacillus macerans TaxID=44252 RepID=UPI003D3134C5
MNKKWIKRGTVFGVGATLLLASGLSAMAGTSGYETYKSAIKHTYAATSFTNQGSIVVTDNGKKILSADLEMKLNKETNAMSGEVAVTGTSETKSFQIYKQDGKMVFAGDDSEVYRVLPLSQEERSFEDRDSQPPQHAEQLMEALMGNLKDLATVEELPSGNKQASLHLSGSQIPAIVQAVGSMAAGHMTSADRMAADGGWNMPMGHGGAMMSNDEDMMKMHPSLADFDFPALTDDVKVEDIRIDAEISPDQYVEQQQGQIKVSGTDAEGNRHELVIAIDFDLSGFGQTTPETVDLTGKQVETIEREAHHPHWQR